MTLRKRRWGKDAELRYTDLVLSSMARPRTPQARRRGGAYAIEFHDSLYLEKLLNSSLKDKVEEMEDSCFIILGLSADSWLAECGAEGAREAFEPELQRIINKIDELQAEEDRDGYTFKPTPRARKSAEDYIVEAYRKTEGKLPCPRVVPDGKGGIIMEWRQGEDIVKLGCVSTDTKRDYIYYRRGNVYDVVEASVDDLIRWLDWLN